MKDKERFKTELAEYEAEKEAGDAVTKPGPSKVQNTNQESEESGELVPVVGSTGPFFETNESALCAKKGQVTPSTPSSNRRRSLW